MHNVVVKRLVLEAIKHLFHPRHSNNHRAKVLHPEWLIAFSILVIVGIVGAPFVKSQSNKLGFVLGYASDITTNQVLVLTNQQRAQSGLAALAMSNQLSSAASAKAADMFQNQYWAHVSPSGREPWDFISASGYGYRVAGENLARDFNHSSDMVQAWMDSPTHRANIMNGRYTETGLAVVNGVLQGVETTLVVQMFGAPAVAAPQLAQAPPLQEVPQAIPTSNPAIPTPTLQVASVAAVVAEPSPTVAATATTGEVQLTAPRTAVLAREIFPKGTLQSFNHIDPLSIIKSFLISILIVLLGTLIYDLYAIGHYHSLRIVGKNVAHILFFATVAFLIIFFKSGAVI